MKTIKIATIILAIVLVTIVAFFGVYVPVQNRMENKVKEYSYEMDLKGARNIRLKVNKSNKTVIKDADGKKVQNSDNLTDEEIQNNGYTKEEVPYNAEENIKEENYEQVKQIMEKRLKKLNVNDYSITVDKNTGDICLQIPENDDTDSIVSNLTTVGKFEIIDSQTQEVLMDNKDIKLANVMYGSGSTTSTTSSGTSVYLNIEFTKEGAKKLEDISNKYTSIATGDENETSSESTADNSEEDKNKKEITMMVDDTEIMSTSFDETLRTGKLQLSIGSSTTESKTLEGYVNQANNMANVLDTGKMELQYDVDENQYILSNITKEDINVIEYITLGVISIAILILVIRYKTNGLLGAISYVGLISIFLLLIRYANVTLSIQGLLGIGVVMILSYIFINKILYKIKEQKTETLELNKKIKEVYLEFFVAIIPICIASITFSLINWAPISSFGMVMFWGIVLIAIYNIIITNNLLKINANK